MIIIIWQALERSTKSQKFQLYIRESMSRNFSTFSRILKHYPIPNAILFIPQPFTYRTKQKQLLQRVKTEDIKHYQI